MYDNLFKHSFIEGHLDYFQVLAIMNRASTNIHVQVLVWIHIFKLFG